MAERPHVTTAQELDAMTPAERQQHFEDSIVRPDSLSDEQRERLFAHLDDVAASNRGGVRRAS